MPGFECCHHCIAPKRHPGCHGTCPEYKEARAEHDAKKEAHDRKRQIANGINHETGRQILKITRRQRKKR